MNNRYMIDSYQAHFHMQFPFSDNIAVIESEPHLVLMCKTSLLSASLAVQNHAGYSILLANKIFIMTEHYLQNCFVSKSINIFHIWYLY